MIPLILDEFKATTFAAEKVTSIIATGKPKKILWITRDPEPLNIFVPDADGRTIFHHLAIKGQFHNFVDTFFGARASLVMLRREGVNSVELLKDSMNAVDSKGFTLLHLLARTEPNTLHMLKTYGITFSTGNCTKFFLDFKQAMPKLELKEFAEIFLRDAVSKGKAELLTEFTATQLYPHLPFIAETVKGLVCDAPKYQGAKKIFANIFQKHLSDVLSHSDNILLNMQKVMQLLQVVKSYAAEDITSDQWAVLLKAPAFTNIDQVKEFILTKCAERFLDGTLPKLQLEDLVADPKALDRAKLQGLIDASKLVTKSFCAEFFTKHVNIKELYANLPSIIKAVQDLARDPKLYPSAKNIFTYIFQNHCLQVLKADSKENEVPSQSSESTSETASVAAAAPLSEYQKKMTIVLKLSQFVDSQLDETKKISLITMTQWGDAFGAGADAFENLNQVQAFILAKCAERFLDGTLLKMTFKDLVVNSAAFPTAQWREIQEAERVAEAARVKAAQEEAERAVEAARVEKLRQEEAERAEEVARVEKLRQEEEAAKLQAQQEVGAGAAAEFPSKVISHVEIGGPIPRDVNPPGVIRNKAVVQGVGEPNIKALAATAVAKIHKSTTYSNGLAKDLGEAPFNEFHVFISVLGRAGNFFNLVFSDLAKKSKTNVMSQDEFLTQYVATLQTSDLLAVTNHARKPLVTFKLVCLTNNVKLAQLVFERGLELNIYTPEAANSELFESAMKYKAAAVTEYLLGRQEITVDWYYVLVQAMKYSNEASAAAIRYYITHAELGLANDIRTRDGKNEGDLKYTILNKSMFHACVLATHSSKASENHEVKTFSVKKLLRLVDQIKALITADKIYYAETDVKVLEKTLGLLKFLVKSVGHITEDDITTGSVEGANELVYLIVTKFEELPSLTDLLVKSIARFKTWMDKQDAKSVATALTTDSWGKGSALTDFSFTEGLDAAEMEDIMNSRDAELLGDYA